MFFCSIASVLDSVQPQTFYPQSHWLQDVRLLLKDPKLNADRKERMKAR